MVDEIKKTNEALDASKAYNTAVEAAADYIEHFDILETITNVGNDEVFTPRKTCEMMLDCLPEEVWHNPLYKWLNPATKNGIFEREIALRLDKGLENVIVNKEERRKHILQNMIFSIGQTKFTSNVARRTLYYCSQANRKCDGIKAPDGHYVNGYAIGNGTWFNDEEGNIKTPFTDHEYIDSKGKRMPSTCKGEDRKKYKCKYCGMNGTSKYNDANQREKYAYELIHINHLVLEKHMQNRFFGGDRKMKFDIIIGNPPYQLNDGGGTGSSAAPIYNLFVEQAICLKPKYLCMIIPSRWFSGGKGLDDFRTKMINDHHISLLHDYMNAKICFPTASIEGGVCYFLWDREHNGECTIITHDTDGSILDESTRFLGSSASSDIFVRNEKALDVLECVKKIKFNSFDNIVSSRNPFKLGDPTDICELSPNGNNRVLGYFERIRSFRYLKKEKKIPSGNKYINKYKLFVSKADGAAGQIGNPVPARIMGKAELGEPGDVCSETYLVVGPFDTKEEALNAQLYMQTKFFRFMVGIRKNKNMPKDTYKFAPIVDFSKKWSDKDLYAKFGLTDEQISTIETFIAEI